MGATTAAKLQLDDGTGNCLTSPVLIEGGADILFIPEITVIDIYNYLRTFSRYYYSTLRCFYKMEGYTMFKDGFVNDVQGVRWDLHKDYVAMKAKVRPRTNEKDPMTKLNYYSSWIIFNTQGTSTLIKSAYCTCKGG